MSGPHFDAESDRLTEAGITVAARTDRSAQSERHSATPQSTITKSPPRHEESPPSGTEPAAAKKQQRRPILVGAAIVVVVFAAVRATLYVVQREIRNHYPANRNPNSSRRATAVCRPGFNTYGHCDGYTRAADHNASGQPRRAGSAVPHRTQRPVGRDAWYPDATIRNGHRACELLAQNPDKSAATDTLLAQLSAAGKAGHSTRRRNGRGPMLSW